MCVCVCVCVCVWFCCFQIWPLSIGIVLRLGKSFNSTHTHNQQKTQNKTERECQPVGALGKPFKSSLLIGWGLSVSFFLDFPKFSIQFLSFLVTMQREFSLLENCIIGSDTFGWQSWTSSQSSSLLVAFRIALNISGFLNLFQKTHFFNQ